MPYSIPSALPLYFQGCWDAFLIAINATFIVTLCAVSYKSVTAHIKFKVGTGWHSKSIVLPNFDLYCSKHMQHRANYLLALSPTSLSQVFTLISYLPSVTCWNCICFVTVFMYADIFPAESEFLLYCAKLPDVLGTWQEQTFWVLEFRSLLSQTTRLHNPCLAP